MDPIIEEIIDNVGVDVLRSFLRLSERTSILSNMKPIRYEPNSTSISVNSFSATNAPLKRGIQIIGTLQLSSAVMMSFIYRVVHFSAVVLRMAPYQDFGRFYGNP